MKFKCLLLLVLLGSSIAFASELPTQTESFAQWAIERQSTTKDIPKLETESAFQWLLRSVSEKLRSDAQEPFKQFVQECNQRERETDNTHISLYHGRSFESLAWLDLNKAIYGKCLNNSEKYASNQGCVNHTILEPEQFVFWRNPAQAVGELDDLPDLENISNKEWASKYDEHNHIRQCLLAASLSPLDMPDSAESAADMFSYNRSINILPSVFERIAEEQGLVSRYAVQLLALYKEFFAKESHGCMTQLVIPHGIAHECSYLSKAYGIPYSRKNQAQVAEFINKGGKVLQRDIVPSIKALKHNQFVLQHDYRLYPQVRIMLASKYFSNPSSGIKMYHHYSVNPKKAYDFNQRRTTLLQRMLKR